MKPFVILHELCSFDTSTSEIAISLFLHFLHFWPNSFFFSKHSQTFVLHYPYSLNVNFQSACNRFKQLAISSFNHDANISFSFSKRPQNIIFFVLYAQPAYYDDYGSIGKLFVTWNLSSCSLVLYCHSEFGLTVKSMESFNRAKQLFGCSRYKHFDELFMEFDNSTCLLNLLTDFTSVIPLGSFESKFVLLWCCTLRQIVYGTVTSEGLM